MLRSKKIQLICLDVSYSAGNCSEKDENIYNYELHGMIRMIYDSIVQEPGAWCDRSMIALGVDALLGNYVNAEDTHRIVAPSLFESLGRLRVA